MSDARAIRDDDLRLPAARPAGADAPVPPATPHQEPPLQRDFKTLLVWTVGHATRILPLLIVAVVVAVDVPLGVWANAAPP